MLWDGFRRTYLFATRRFALGLIYGSMEFTENRLHRVASRKCQCSMFRRESRIHLAEKGIQLHQRNGTSMCNGSSRSGFIHLDIQANPTLPALESSVEIDFVDSLAGRQGEIGGSSLPEVSLPLARYPS